MSLVVCWNMSRYVSEWLCRLGKGGKLCGLGAWLGVVFTYSFIWTEIYGWGQGIGITLSMINSDYPALLSILGMKYFDLLTTKFIEKNQFEYR